MTEGSAGRPATIRDVARRAGVSHETVSRVLRGEAAVKAANRDQVLAAVAALRYRPNATAKALATRQSHRLGALVYDLREAGPSEFVEGASEEARGAGYVLDIVSVRTATNGDVDAALALLNQTDLAGIIAFTPTDASREALTRGLFDIPVFFETEGEDIDEHGSVSLNFVGVSRAMDHLIELGHERILHVSGPGDWVSARNRERAYLASMHRNGLEPLPRIAATDWSAASGYEAASRLPDEPRPTAILAANDQVALGLLLALHQRGLTVPDDMSIIGFDDIPESAFTIPPLSTVGIDFGQAGRRAVRSLLGQIRSDTELAGELPDPVTVRLHLRSSTASPRG